MVDTLVLSHCWRMNCSNPVLRIWCVPHQLDIVVKNATHGVLDEAFYKVFSVHLRAQQILITEMGSKCLKDMTRWVAFGNILRWLLEHRGTPSLIDDSRGRQATGSSAIHAMVGYRRSASTFVRADRCHICHALVFELGNLLVAPRGVEPDGGHCSRFRHSLNCGCYVDQQDRSHHDHLARWLDRHQRCRRHAHPRSRLVGTRSVQRAFRH